MADDAGNAFTYTYDSLSRRTAWTDPDLGAWSFTYDAADNLLTQTDALSQVTKYTYDKLNRELTGVARFGTSQAETITTAYHGVSAGYDNSGRVTKRSNPAGTIDTLYDLNGRETKRTYTVGGKAYPVTTTYDIGGRVLFKTYPDGDTSGSTATPWTYDAANRLLTIPGAITATTYTARGQVASITYANGVTTTYTHDAARGWLTSVVTAKGATTIQSLTYSRDAAGRIRTITSPTSGEGWTYTYDDLDRLLTATNASDATLTESFTYNSVGNILTSSRLGAYTYPAAGAARPHAVTAVGGQTISYDANGNMLAGLGRKFTWDGQNRPTAITSGAFMATFTVGPDGERLTKTANTGPGGALQTTLYLGGDAQREPDQTWHKYPTGDFKRVGTGTVQTVFHHRDHLSTVKVMTNATGAEAQRSKYRPFGQRASQTTTLKEDQAFIGEKTDPETGLLYLHARYYDPNIGRMVSPDWWRPDQPGVGTNRYSYSSNNPINRRDNDGNSDWDTILSQIFCGCRSGLPASQIEESVSRAKSEAQDFALDLGRWTIENGTPVGAFHDAYNSIEAFKGGYYLEGGLSAASAFAGLAPELGAATKIARRGASRALDAFSSASTNSAKQVEAYEVGLYLDLKKRSIGDQMQVHHVMQSHPANQVIDGYERNGAPAIVLPDPEHRQIPNITGQYSGSARDLLARDIMNLRNITEAPNASLQRLIEFNKKKYPDALAK